MDAYRRRVLASPDAVYEHTWRLIHLSESIVLTCGSLVATRLLHYHGMRSDVQRANRIRRRLTGLAIQGPEQLPELPASESCLDGYINPWITLLRETATEDIDCPFHKEMARYLLEELEPLPFLAVGVPSLTYLCSIRNGFLDWIASRPSTA